MKDSAILTDDGQLRALPTTFRHDERRIETDARSSQLARAGFSVADPLLTPLEGGDVAILEHRRIALLGYGVRTERESAVGLARFLGCDVVPLELRDPALFHLDVALTVLADDTLVYCREAFTHRALNAIETLRFTRVIEVSLSAARRFSLNIVQVGDTVITGTDSAAITGLWRSLGFDVEIVPLDQFQLAGGSAACLVARVPYAGSAHRIAA